MAKTKTEKVVEETEVEETNEVAFGVADIVTLIKEKLGETTTTRELRTLLRKMARDGRLDREIIPGNRARWEWSGPNDPEVKAILKAFKAGELEQDKKEKLEALKEQKAAKKAAKKAAAAAAAAEAEDDDEDEVEEEEEAEAKAKPKAKPVVEDDDELELDEDED